MARHKKFVLPEREEYPEPISTRVSGRIKEQIYVFANEERRTVSNMVRILLEEAIQARHRKFKRQMKRK